MCVCEYVCVSVRLCLCAGMRPPMGPVGGEVPFLGPNLMPPFGVVPGPDGMHRPPFPGLPLPPHMGGGGVGPEDRYRVCTQRQACEHTHAHNCI